MFGRFLLGERSNTPPGNRKRRFVARSRQNQTRSSNLRAITSVRIRWGAHEENSRLGCPYRADKCKCFRASGGSISGTVTLESTLQPLHAAQVYLSPRGLHADTE